MSGTAVNIEAALAKFGSTDTSLPTTLGAGSVGSSLSSRSSSSEVSETLLGCKRGGIAGEWQVKNTFLVFSFDERLGDNQPRCRAATTPGDLGIFSEGTEEEEDEEERCDLELPMELSTGPTAPMLLLSSEPAALAAPSMSRLAAVPQQSWPGGYFGQSCTVPMAYCAQSVPVQMSFLSHSLPGAPVEAQEQRTLAVPGTPSAGSAMHYKGRCKPCAFVWKEQGCENGTDCLFCHLCGPDEIVARKRAKKERMAAARLRKAQKAAKAAAAESVGMEVFA